MNSRREFLRGTAWMLGVAALGGCRSSMPFGDVDPITNFTVPPMSRIRVGVIGIGERGTWAVHRLSGLPGVEIAALCDVRPEAAEEVISWLNKNGKSGTMHSYKGRQDSWKGLCDDVGVDVVYICAPAILHAEMELYALAAGKHVMVEVPAAQTIDECWAVVEATEKARRHCMMLENCIYGENELLAWNLAHKGLLGTLTHAEGGYIHNLVWRQFENHPRTEGNRHGTVLRYGNTYPTHALGPICTYMDMNRGDRMERIVSLSSLSAAHPEFARATYGADEWQNKIDWRTGDMNTSIIRTAKGRTIMMQLDMSTPRPYSRINLIQGSKGCFYDYPLRLSLSKRSGGDGHDWKTGEYEWLDEKRLAEIKREYKHPLHKAAGEVAEKVGGHGGMDFLMDIRWVYCLQNGLPLDMDVYDLASWSSIVPCSAESDRRGGEPVEIPDFTRGRWQTAKPVEIGSVDLDKMGYDRSKAKRDESRQEV